MASIKRSERHLDRDRIAALKAVARQIDAEESAEIRAKAGEAFREHEEIRSLIDDLKAQRKSRGLSLAEIARRSGISKPNLSRLENNAHASPTFDTLRRYASAMGKAVRLMVTESVGGSGFPQGR